MMKSLMSLMFVWAGLIALYSSYLLVFRVLRSEVAVHQLEFKAEMRQSVQQIHPPGRRVVHYSCHPEQLPSTYHFTVSVESSHDRCKAGDESWRLTGLRNVHINNNVAGKLLSV